LRGFFLLVCGSELNYFMVPDNVNDDCAAALQVCLFMYWAIDNNVAVQQMKYLGYETQQRQTTDDRERERRGSVWNRLRWLFGDKLLYEIKVR
jgi:hypothetical protein